MAKENKVKSKIPIPVDPLPPLSENTLKKNPRIKTDRHPLETLYQESVNSEKVATHNRKIKKALRRSNSVAIRADTRHVTVRQKTEDLDWNYKVFKDMSDDEQKKGTLLKADNRAGETSKISTPALKSFLEPCRVRNIKRSLKRPHSRELQGISPVVTDDLREEKHKRRLVFTDRFEKRWHSTDFWLNSYATCLSHNYGPDLFNYLLEKETITKVPRIPSTPRASVINWLLNVNGPGGNPAAVQTAAWYFDTVLTIAQTSAENMQVLAAACYWIALKIQGNVISSKKLVKAAANVFTVELLIVAESAVMERLKFPIQPIVAQDFIAYMSWVCDAANFVEIETAATLMFMAGLVVNPGLPQDLVEKDGAETPPLLSSNYPSILAAAAVRNALLVLKKRELLRVLETNDVYKAAVKKGSNFDFLCSLQWWALRKMSSPNYDYRALLEKAQNRILTDKIVASVNTNSFYLELSCI
ncbi:jg25450 [Pararge aegeria aegeria]|uniref:Jg25450 protein n=2 Tax=Pararge aegeria TaxID=116150 RepID=A0A8S4S8M3_9NEOP|nr:jg25450 [Pararge aegeria aegeria]